MLRQLRSSRLKNSYTASLRARKNCCIESRQNMAIKEPRSQRHINSRNTVSHAQTTALGHSGSIKVSVQAQCTPQQVKAGKYVRFSNQRVERSRSGMLVAEVEKPAVGASIILERKLDAGNPHVRFDQRGMETQVWLRLRHRLKAKAVRNSKPLNLKLNAPALDSPQLPNHSIE